MGSSSCSKAGARGPNSRGIHSGLDRATAPLRTAQAPELPVVLGLAVVGGQFRSRPDVPQRIELRAILRAADVRVRCARMVDVAEPASRARRVERVPVELDDRDDAPALRAAARLREPDHLAFELSDLRARGDARAREKAEARDLASPHGEPFVDAAPVPVLHRAYDKGR